MISINGIEFDSEWLKQFKTAEEFAEHAHAQAFIERSIVSKDDLKSYFSKFVKNDNQGLQSEAAEVKLPKSSVGRNRSEKGRNSGLASDTV